MLNRRAGFDDIMRMFYRLLGLGLIIVIGDKEEKNKTLAVRTRDGKVKYGIKLEKLIDKIKDRVIKRVNELNIL